MHTLQQTLLDTPWWVYAIFIYVIYRGIRASQTRQERFSNSLVNLTKLK